MITLSALYQSARLRSLPLSVSGIIFGGALAQLYGSFRWDIFVLSTFTTLLFQILSDFANDYGDAQKGTDNSQRLGPKRALARGLMTLTEIKKVMWVTALLSGISALLLIYVSFAHYFWYALLFVGLAGLSIWAAIAYTVGSSAYGYRALGDFFVFVFFGLVSVAGSFFLYEKALYAPIYLPAIACGLLSCGVLNLNNMRDAENDQRMGKITLAVIFGVQGSKYYHYILLLLPMLLLMLFVIMTSGYGLRSLFLLAFVPLVLHLFRVKRITNPKDYDPELKVVALSTFSISLLFALGVIWGQ